MDRNVAYLATRSCDVRVPRTTRPTAGRCSRATPVRTGTNTAPDRRRSVPIARIRRDRSAGPAAGTTVRPFASRRPPSSLRTRNVRRPRTVGAPRWRTTTTPPNRVLRDHQTLGFVPTRQVTQTVRRPKRFVIKSLTAVLRNVVVPGFAALLLVADVFGTVRVWAATAKRKGNGSGFPSESF